MTVSKKKLADLTWEALTKAFPESSCTLDIDSPDRLVIRGILSAQCTDVRVNLTCNDLFSKYPDMESISNLSEETIAELIRPCGLVKGKSRSIKAFATKFINEWNHVVPNDVAALMTCPGIGRKIANLIVGEIYGTPALVVDTHCKRVMFRIGLTNNTDPLKVESDVCKLFDPSCYIRLGHMAVDLGRKYCNSQKPDCENCPLNSFCKKRISK